MKKIIAVLVVVLAASFSSIKAQSIASYSMENTSGTTYHFIVILNGYPGSDRGLIVDWNISYETGPISPIHHITLPISQGPSGNLVYEGDEDLGQYIRIPPGHIVSGAAVDYAVVCPACLKK